jgi:hypothetical protein
VVAEKVIGIAQNAHRGSGRPKGARCEQGTEIAAPTALRANVTSIAPLATH